MKATLKVWPTPFPYGEWCYELKNKSYYLTSYGPDSYTSKRGALLAGRRAAKKFGITINKEEVDG